MVKQRYRREKNFFFSGGIASIRCKSVYILCVYAVSSLCYVFYSMQDDGAADSSAIRRILLKKEAVRLAVIIEDNLFRAAPLEMLFQDLPQFVTQKPTPGNLMEIFPAAEFISACYQFRDGELAPLGTIHILSGPFVSRRLAKEPQSLVSTLLFGSCSNFCSSLRRMANRCGDFFSHEMVRI